MAKILFIITFLGMDIVSTLHAQIEISEIPNIKRSPDYYWGEYTAPSRREAEEKALADLTKMISVRIQSTVDMATTENAERLNKDFSNIVKSYSSATLRNVKTFGLPPDKGQFYVFRYIEKTEVEAVFNERKTLVGNMYEKGLESIASGNLNQGLKLFYHAIILLQSIPDSRYEIQGKELSVELPSLINEVINQIQFVVLSDQKVSEKEREIEIQAKGKKYPITSLSVSYWDGQDQNNILFVDGKTSLKLYGSATQLKSISFTINTQYYESRNEIKEVSELWDFVKKPFILSEKKIDFKKDLVSKKQKTSSTSPLQTWVIPAIKTESLNMSTELLSDYANQIKTISIGLEKKEKVELKDSFLAEKVQQITKYSQIRFTTSQGEVFANKTWEGTEVRPLKALNRFNRIKLESPEVLVYDFGTNNELNDVNFGVFPDLYAGFQDQSRGNAEDWAQRQVIIKFMERYRTGFLTRDAAFISKMFSDDAVVIVGRVLKPGEKSNPYQYVPEGKEQPNVEYVKLTKQEYVDRQKKLFTLNQDMFLGFSSFTINRTNNQPGIFGVSLRQHYQADTYADEGNLFLLVDFNGEEPQIYVRAWQPNEWNPDALINLSNFKVLK